MTISHVREDSQAFRVIVTVLNRRPQSLLTDDPFIEPTIKASVLLRPFRAKARIKWIKGNDNLFLDKTKETNHWTCDDLCRAIMNAITQVLIKQVLQPIVLACCRCHMQRSIAFACPTVWQTGWVDYICRFGTHKVVG